MYEVIFALLPIALLFALMVIFRLPAVKAMPAAWISGVIVALFFWKMPALLVSAAAIKGIMIALEIVLIVLGAIFLLEVLKKARIIPVIDSLLKQISSDKRIHIIIIAWSFGAFIEGAAGFGTPAALAAPLLVGLRIPALTAVTVSLIANSAPVSFGAIGTPILIGIGTTISSSREFLNQLSINVALIHAIIGLFIPLLISCVYTRLAEKSFRKGLEIWPFALFAGACFAIPYFLIAVFFGPEFPSLLGGLLGFIILIASSRKGFLIPKRYRAEKSKINIKKAFSALLPYILAAVLLIISRTKSVNFILKKAALQYDNILGTGISQTFFPLVSPGTIFLLAAIITLLLFKESMAKAEDAVKKTASKVGYTFIALAFTVALVQIFLVSGSNAANLESMPVVVAKALASLTGKAYILFAPIIGLFGAFIAGSNTVSNLLFASFQQETAIALGLAPIIIIALQVVGGAIGNMIAVHNIIAACSTVGLKAKEGLIIKHNLLPAFVYAILAGLIGIILLQI